MKLCTKCKVEKPSADFPSDKRNATGLSSWCRGCHKARSRKKEAEPGYAEKRQAAAKARRQRPENKEKERARREKYRTDKQRKDRESRLTPGGRARSLWNAAKRRADKKGEAFELSKERIENALLIGVCEFTGLEFDLENKLRVGETGRSPLTPSVDKIDPLKPYSDDNVSIVCDWYNMAKGRLSSEQLIEFCKRLLIANGYEVN